MCWATSHFTIDGKPLDFSDTVTYRGMMFTGVPNLVWVFGYFRASWTLRADLVADFVCRLLNHMEKKGARAVDAGAAPRGQGHAAAALDGSGELQPRLSDARHASVAQGAATSRNGSTRQDYWTERKRLPTIDLDDPAFVYR